MKKVLNIYKPLGYTPLQAIREFQSNHKKYKDSKMAYAGRLDPMAEGVLVVLVGDECKNRDFYQDQDKEYEFEILFGYSTDTYDILGIPRRFSGDLPKKSELIDALQTVLQKHVGRFTQKFPVYSSKPVEGKPLFAWAREGKLDQIEIPQKEVEIYTLQYLDEYEISDQDLVKQVEQSIAKVDGDFRQEKIIDKWKEIALKNPGVNYVVRLRSVVGSGTYIRQLVNDIGEELGVDAVTFSILRISVGEFHAMRSLPLDED